MKNLEEFLNVFKYVEGKEATGELLAEHIDMIVHNIVKDGVDKLTLSNVEAGSKHHQLNKISYFNFDTTFYLGNFKMTVKPGPNNTFRVECDDAVSYPVTKIISRENFDVYALEELAELVDEGFKRHIAELSGVERVYITYTNYIKRFEGAEIRFVDEDSNLRFFKYEGTEDVISTETNEPIDFFNPDDEQYQKFVNLLKATITWDINNSAKKALMKEFHTTMSEYYSDVVEAMVE